MPQPGGSPADMVQKRQREVSLTNTCVSVQASSAGGALTATVNCAKPSAKELLSIFEGHIANGTLALCDGLRSYHALPEIADGTVKDCNDREVVLPLEHNK